MPQGFFQLFAQGGAKRDCMDYCGGKYVSKCKACGKVEAPLGNFYFGPFIRRNLVESGTVFTLTVYCVILARYYMYVVAM